MATATQVESFCESCGTRYAFEPRRARGRHLVRMGRMVGILADDGDVDSGALVVSRDPFHGAFHFCLECRRFTCPSCWDTSAGFCRSCAMATGALDAGAGAEHTPDPETEAILQAAYASLLALGSNDEWQRLGAPPAPRAEIWAAPPELVDTPSDDLAPMIEAGLAALGAKALLESERAEAAAEQRRLALELQRAEEHLVAEQAEQLRLAAEAEQAQQAAAMQQAWEDQQSLEAEQSRQAWEAQQVLLAHQAQAEEQARLAQEGERQRLADEAEAAQRRDVTELARLAMLAAVVAPPAIIEHEMVAGPEPVAEPEPVAAPEPVAEPTASTIAPAEPPAMVVAAPEAAAVVDPVPVVTSEPIAPPPPAAPVVAAPAFAELAVPDAALPPAEQRYAAPAPMMPPPPQPVAWQMMAPVTPNPTQWAPPPQQGWNAAQMSMAGMVPPAQARQSRSPFAIAPTAHTAKGGVRPCPRCDLPLSGQARFCRRCGLPQA